MRATRIDIATTMRAAGAAAALAAPLAATAADFSWDGGTDAFKHWSSNENWVGDTAPVSDAATRIFLTGFVNTGSTGGPLTNDIATPLTLNYLGIMTATNTGSEPLFAVAGEPLRFTTNGSTQPIFYSSRKATSTIYNPIEIAATALTFRATTYAVNFNGAVSGDGALIYDGPLGGAGGLTLNEANTFTGGLIYKNRSATTNTTWSKLTINTSGAMGTGPVELYGGNRETLTNYGATGNYGNERTSGIIFRGNTLHSNDFEIRQEAPIFVGDHGSHTTAASVRLLGSIDLNTNGLWLRGPAAATGTIESNIFSTGGGGRLVKLDPGTWILNGSNSYEGPTDVSMGRLFINGDNRSATGLVTVAGGSLLGGNGIVGGKTVFQAGATNAPGMSPGIQTFASGVTYSNDSVLVWEIYTNTSALADRGAAFDGINVTGGQLDVIAGADLQLVFNAGGSSNIVDWSDAFWAQNQQWLLFDLSGTATTNAGIAKFDIGTNNFQDIQGDWLQSVHAGAYFDTYYDTTGDMYLSYVIPEPSSWALLAFGAGLLAAARRRRR